MEPDERYKKLVAYALLPWLVILMVLILVPFALWSAFVYQHLYTWFIRPLSPIFPPITVLGFYGIVLFFGIFRKSTASETPKSTVTRLVVEVFGSALVLLVGFIIKGHIK